MVAAETVREWQENVMMRRQTTTVHLNYEKNNNNKLLHHINFCFHSWENV